jgi:cytochrome P450
MSEIVEYANRSNRDAIMENQSGLDAPQAGYLAAIQAGGYVELEEGLGMSFARADTEYIVRNHAMFSNACNLDMGNVRPIIPINIDPPQHTRYRKLLDPLFSAKRMDAQEDDIAVRVNAYIDRFIDRGECNFTEEFADLFPSSVFLGLMGLPEEELPTFLEMRDGIEHPERLDPGAAADRDVRLRVINEAGKKVYQYFGDLIEDRREKPTGDIISHFVAAEVGGDRLTDEEILDICYMLLIGGLDTVTDTLTCAYAFLAKNHAHRQMLVDDPAIIPAAVEELLRWESPAHVGAPRITKCPVDLPSGASIEAGRAVVPHWGGANVDPSAYDDPLVVRFDRARNPHFGFGSGIHKCLGQHLARRELRVTLREWHRRIPTYHIKPGHEQLEYPPGLRHVKNLMLSWGNPRVDRPESSNL